MLHQDFEANRQILLELGAMIDDPTDPMGKMYFNILATFAEFEVDLLRMRTPEGMAIAKAKGKRKGRALLVKPHAAGEHIGVEPAELFEVSGPAVYRVLERAQTVSGAA